MGTEFYGVADNKFKSNISPSTITPLMINKIHKNNLENNNSLYGIKSGIDCVILPHSSQLISTGIFVAIPKGYIGIIKQRDSLLNNDIVTFTSIIDSNYRKEVMIKMFNFSNDYYKVKNGQIIANLLIIKTLDDIFKEVDELPIQTTDLSLEESLEASS